MRASPWPGRPSTWRRSVGDGDAESDALNTIGCAIGWWQDVEEGAALIRRSLEISLAVDGGHLAGRAYANLTSCWSTTPL